MVKFRTEPVPAGETCPVCEEGFEAGEHGMMFREDGTSRWLHIHVRCIEGDVVRDDLGARLGRRVVRLARRFVERF